MEHLDQLDEIHNGEDGHGEENLDDDNEEWTVEDILDKYVENDISYYRIKWLGFQIESASWEPEENIDAPALLENFNQRWNERNRIRRETFPRGCIICGDDVEELCYGKNYGCNCAVIYHHTCLIDYTTPVDCPTCRVPLETIYLADPPLAPLPPELRIQQEGLLQQDDLGIAGAN